MAENGIRQLGEPRIGIFADRMKPDPLHLEINNWTHCLNVIYQEAVRRNKFREFSTILKAPVKCSNDNAMSGCGMRFVGKMIEEHYADEKKRLKTPEVRLIGAQAILLAQYGHRLVDTLKLQSESDVQAVTRLALAQIVISLRDVGSLINKVYINNETYPDDVSFFCKKYFNLFSLFFPLRCNITVWTMGYVVPFHAKEIFNNFRVGYGILSMQGKESKHSSIKQELKSCSNRSTATDEKGKWHQLMRSSFVRNFYLPYHFPLPSNYHSHYQSRKPVMDIEACHCCRPLESETLCSVCISSLPLLVCVNQKCLTQELVLILKPIQCSSCSERFSDINMCNQHQTTHHQKQTATNKNLVPRSMSVGQLKEELKLRKKAVTGKKEDLIRRLEGTL